MDRPADAVGEYADFSGRTLWIKDIKPGAWPIARLWSVPKNRWRTKREHVWLDRVTTFEPQEQS